MVCGDNTYGLYGYVKYALLVRGCGGWVRGYNNQILSIIWVKGGGGNTLGVISVIRHKNLGLGATW